MMMAILVAAVAGLERWPGLLLGLHGVLGPYAVLLVQGAVVLGAVAVITGFGRGGVASLGLRTAAPGRDVATGLLWAVPMYGATVIVTVAFLFGLLALRLTTVDSLLESKKPILDYVGRFSPLAAVPVMAFVGFYEETLFRGFVLGRLLRITRRAGPAVVVSSILFGLLHVPTQGWLGFVQTACLGALFAVLTLWRGTIWPAVAAHAGINVVGYLLILALGSRLDAWLAR